MTDKIVFCSEGAGRSAVGAVIVGVAGSEEDSAAGSAAKGWDGAGSAEQLNSKPALNNKQMLT
jgi:hypothetical protein